MVTPIAMGQPTVTACASSRSLAPARPMAALCTRCGAQWPPPGRRRRSHPPRAARVRDPEFHDRVAAETRALLATVPA